ncbi:MAG: hypothetical protein NVSMB20_22520 [Bradyrhizobium sp.]
MGSVVAVSLRSGHHFSKTPSLGIRLLTGLGVAGDSHICLFCTSDAADESLPV